MLRAETERLLTEPRSQRFREAFLDYWLDLRKIEDSTPSTTLYNDYYLDDALTEAALAETQLYFAELLRAGPPGAASDRRRLHLPQRAPRHPLRNSGVRGVAMRRVALPPTARAAASLTQASVLKVTANGTTTSPGPARQVDRGAHPRPPDSPAAARDRRRTRHPRRGHDPQQLAKHRADPSCASCHRKMDPPGFALESFDVMGGWRDRYRGIADDRLRP
jgi:hypothetical protein